MLLMLLKATSSVLVGRLFEEDAGAPPSKLACSRTCGTRTDTNGIRSASNAERGAAEIGTCRSC